MNKALNIYEIHRAEHADYDEAERFIVMAHGEIEARELVSTRCGDEGPDVWLDNRKTWITKIGTAESFYTLEQIVMRSFLYG